jgi:transposase
VVNSVRIQAVEKRIRQAIEGDPIVMRLLKLPGVGFVTAATLRAEIGRFERFDTGKQLARFCGVSRRSDRGRESPMRQLTSNQLSQRTLARAG